jgi:hypothetical protein
MTMGSHQTSIGKNDSRFTPRYVFEPLGPFPTDAATGKIRPWNIGTERNITVEQDTLTMDWREFGRTWLNPPFNRFGVGLFVRKMCEHNHGTLLLHVRTETEWFKPIWDSASALFFLSGRVIFCNEDGTPCKIENPNAKHFGKSANSGAPVVLCAFGEFDSDVLAAQSRDFGEFVPRIFQRGVLVMPLPDDQSWRVTINEWLQRQSGPVRVSDLYRVFQGHPKAKCSPYWREQIRKVLQLGAGKSIGHDQWVAA